MYFNHAFQKTLINTNGFYTTGGNPTSVLVSNPAKVAVVASVTTPTYFANQTIDITAAVPTIQQLPMVYLAQGTINTVDKLGPLAGGYQESVKTKFFRVDPSCAEAEVQTVCLCDGANPVCGTSYYLRIDVKGSPALRFLSHNVYRTFASSNVCCPVDPDPLDPTALYIDAMQVQTSWAWQIARDPIMSQFIAPTLTWANGVGEFDVVAWFAANPTLMDTDLYAAIQVAPGPGNPYLTGLAYVPGTSDTQCLVLTGAYVDTQFGTCSFHPQDFYELAPVKIYPSITDQQGDPCVDQVWCTNLEQLGVQASGYGHKLLRDVLLFRRYLQENYVYDPRLREVMNQDQVFNYINGTSFYTTYGILHSVPRFNNPTGVFDNDQYLITIIMPSSACNANQADTNFEVAAGNSVQLETFGCPIL
jgi:hypothetical protein